MLVDGHVLLTNLAATETTDALVALVDIVTVDGLDFSRASFARSARGFILLGFPGMGLAPARTTGGNLVSIGVAKARILFLHMLGMGRAKRLLPLLRTGFAPALASIRGGTLRVERV